jgi:DNA polymerase sigma
MSCWCTWIDFFPGAASFSTVVLFLKTLLAQHDLDVPFRGGLGSYKLYVLVAYHLQQRSMYGAPNDDCGEVLLSFLYRYGANHSNNVNSTRISKGTVLETFDGSSASLDNVFKIKQCVELFRLCHDRLSAIVSNKNVGKKPQVSILAELIAPDKLMRDRQQCMEKLRKGTGKLKLAQARYS